MKRTLLSLLAITALCFAAQRVQAQVPVITYYQPTTVYSPVVGSVPVVTPAPVVTQVYSPVVVQPAPVAVTTFYRAPVVTMQPTTQVVTRYRPILGGSVSRVRYGWTPVAY